MRRGRHGAGLGASYGQAPSFSFEDVAEAASRAGIRAINVVTDDEPPPPTRPTRLTPLADRKAHLSP